MTLQRVLMSLFAASLWVFSGSATEAETNQDAVLRQADGHAPIASDLDDAAWLAGHWRGSRFAGHSVEHVILPKASGHMPGVVRSWAGDDIFFFEITNFEVLDGVLHYRVKHFSDDLTGWEAADQVISRPLLGKSETRLQFETITFQQTSEDGFTVYYRFPDGPRAGDMLVIPFERIVPTAPDEDDDLEAVRVILSDLDRLDLQPAQQLRHYTHDAVILAPGQLEIRGHAAIQVHLADARDAAVINLTHEIVTLSAFRDVVIVQGRAIGTAQPHGATVRYPFETKNLITFKRLADGSLKIWKVIYNNAPPSALPDPEPVAGSVENPFQRMLGVWTLKDDRFEQVWDGETVEVLTIPGHRTVCSALNTSQSVLCRVNAVDFHGHILWAADGGQNAFGHLSQFGASRLGQGNGSIQSDGSFRIQVRFSDEPEGTYRAYHYEWVSEDEYTMESVQYDAAGHPTGNRYGGTFVRE